MQRYRMQYLRQFRQFSTSYHSFGNRLVLNKNSIKYILSDEKAKQIIVNLGKDNTITVFGNTQPEVYDDIIRYMNEIKHIQEDIQEDIQKDKQEDKQENKQKINKEIKLEKRDIITEIQKRIESLQQANPQSQPEQKKQLKQIQQLKQEQEQLNQPVDFIKQSLNRLKESIQDQILQLKLQEKQEAENRLKLQEQLKQNIELAKKQEQILDIKQKESKMPTYKPFKY